MLRQRFMVKLLSHTVTARCMCSSAVPEVNKTSTHLLGKDYPVDNLTNVTPFILQKIGTDLHRKNNHPIGLLRARIQNFFYNSFLKKNGCPIFSVYDDLSPVVTLSENYDNLLVPKDHPSRAPTDSYYLNSTHMLRAHTTAHQRDLIKSGLNSFLMVGDVYRRDSVDRSHYPVFHQLDGVRLFSRHELFEELSHCDQLKLFEETAKSELNQAGHAYEATLMVQTDLKQCLENLAFELFGPNIEFQWVEAYFPFTHPSWELEIKFQDEWLEVLGCGVIQQQILQETGAGDKIGWAFGLGLERLAMRLFEIPDIRVFWSQDPRFTSQFDVTDPNTPITYKPLSNHPPVFMDVSFWIPDSNFSENDFFEIVHSHEEKLIESVTLADKFTYPKQNRTSLCYRITYRHVDRVLNKEEVNKVHEEIKERAVERLNVVIR